MVSIALHKPSSPRRLYASLSCGLAVLLAFSFGPNFDLCLLSIVILTAGWLILWRPGETAVLLLTFCIQWIGATVSLFHSNWLDTGVSGYSDYGGDMRSAVTLSLFGLLAVAIGMRAGAGKQNWSLVSDAAAIARRQPLIRWFRLYLIAWGLSFLALQSVWAIPGLAQIFLAIASVKWAFFFTLAFAAFVQGSIRSPFFPAAFCLELLTSVGGYFSDFKTVFYFTIFAAAAAGVKLSRRSQLLLGMLIVMLIGFAIVWTEVKTEYRNYVNEGQDQQIAKVEYTVRMGKLAELIGDLDVPKLEDGAGQLIRRISYVEFFAVVLNYVPEYLPHEQGAIFLDAIMRPFMPRILFRDKTVIDDTARTSLYTGGIISGGEGTSISLGYIAESYIDFGRYGMMFALLGCGYVYGWIYKSMLRLKRAGPILGMGFASAILSNIGTLESSFTKTAGGIVVSLLVVWLIIRFGTTHYLDWATKLPNQENASSLPPVRARLRLAGVRPVS